MDLVFESGKDDPDPLECDGHQRPKFSVVVNPHKELSLQCLERTQSHGLMWIGKEDPLY